LAWDAPAEGGQVNGYRLYYGTSAGNYHNSVDLGTAPQNTISGLDEETTYHIVVRAYNEAGESPDSNTVTWESSDTTPPLPPDQVLAD
jgi:hypothetical protein